MHQVMADQMVKIRLEEARREAAHARLVKETRSANPGTRRKPLAAVARAVGLIRLPRRASRAAAARAASVRC